MLSRYLSPEPLLGPVFTARGAEQAGEDVSLRRRGGPGFVAAALRQGRSAPANAYADNNAVKYTDPDGEQIFKPFDSQCYSECQEQAKKASEESGGQQCKLFAWGREDIYLPSPSKRILKATSVCMCSGFGDKMTNLGPYLWFRWVVPGTSRQGSKF